uniref:Putative YvrJ family protein n=1 Tax=viral metagenome TaxID=1070528 RepID=A0A6M3M605_9ZZZZ
MDIVSWIKDLGFPIFVAVFVLVRLEPSVKSLERSITELMVVTAKSNGMGNKDIAAIVEAVSVRKGKKRNRRITDKLGGNDDH